MAHRQISWSTHHKKIPVCVDTVERIITACEDTGGGGKEWELENNKSSCSQVSSQAGI